MAFRSLPFTSVFPNLTCFLVVVFPYSIAAWCLYFSSYYRRTLHYLEDFPAPCIIYYGASGLLLFDRSEFLFFRLPYRLFAGPVGKTDSPPFIFRPLTQLAYTLGCLVWEVNMEPLYIASATSIRSKSYSAARKYLLSKLNPIIIDCFSHVWGTACKRIQLSSSWGISSDLSDPGNWWRRMFRFCILVVDCRSLRPLGLRIMCLVDRFCFVSAFIRNKYLVSLFLISIRLFLVVPPWIFMSIF